MKKLLIIPFLLASYMGMGQTAATIIGTTIKIANLEVAQNDFLVKMNWDDAKKVCASLGKGWRLPTRVELNTLYQNRAKIGGFANGAYWSSNRYFFTNAYIFLLFFNGFYGVSNKYSTFYVRAIRAF